MSSSLSVLGPAGALRRLNDVLHPTGRPSRKPAQGSTMLVRGRRRRWQSRRGRRRRRQSRRDRRRRAVYLCASRELPCRRAERGRARGWPLGYSPPTSVREQLAVFKAKARQGSAKRVGVRDQGSSLEAACPRASHAARRAASRASRPTCRALGGPEAGARQVGSTVYVRMCRALCLSRPVDVSAAPCRLQLRLTNGSLSFTAT